MRNVSKFQKAIRHFKVAGAGLCLLTMAGTANAAFIDLTGTVTNGGVNGDAEPAAPFETNDLLTGFIEINDDAATVGSEFDISDLLGYDISVGSASFNQDNSSPVSFLGGSVSGDDGMLSGFEFTTNLTATDNPGCGACILFLTGDDNAFVVTEGAGSDSQSYSGGLDLSASLREDQGPPPTNSVPEPASVFLFGTGLLGLGLTRLRRRS